MSESKMLIVERNLKPQFLHEMCDAILLIQAKRLSKCSVDLFLLEKSVKQSLEQLRHPKLIKFFTGLL